MKLGDRDRAGLKSNRALFFPKNGLKWTVSIISQNGLKVKVIFFSDILHEVKGYIHT